MTKSLITGGAGFIGSHLANRLLERGDKVRILDDLSSGSKQNLQSVWNDIEFVEGKVQDFETASNAINGIDSVFHLAAMGSVPRSIALPIETHNANATGTLSMLTAAARGHVQRFVFSSSSSVYGDHPVLPKTESNIGQVLSPYAVTKKMGEEYCRVYSDLHGLETVSLRFFNVFGPRQRADHIYAAVIPRFIDAALRGDPLEIHGDGMQSRDFTYIDNNIDGIVAAEGAAAAKVAGRVFNLACEGQITLLAIVDLLEQALAKKLQVTFSDPREGDIRHSFADTTALHSATSYEPSIGVLEGLQRTIQWLRDADVA